jgi:ABC-2 type transport system ATP-binding protein
MEKSNVIEVKNLTFSYSKKTKNILNGLTMRVPKGSIYGFLGANGAGKSTTMQLLTASLTSDKGEIFLFEKNLQYQLPFIFNRMGCLIESPSLYMHLSGYENLNYIAKLKKISKENINEVLHLIGLSENGRQKVREYSMGMKQRLAIGMALLGKPDLLLLDEPINGLDPQGVIDIRNLLIRLNKELGISIFVSSHLLDEIEKICTHIGILSKGKLVYDGSINKLKELSNKTQKVSVTLKDANYFYQQLKIIYDIDIDENTIYMESTEKKVLDEFLISLIQAGATIVEVKTDDKLENLFLHFSK